MKNLKTTLFTILHFGICFFPFKIVAQSTPNLSPSSVNYEVTTSPNPFTDKIIVTIINPIKNQNCSIVVSDLNGKIVKVEPVFIHKGKNTISINLSNLSAGTYFVNSTDSKVIRKAIRIIKL